MSFKQDQLKDLNTALLKLKSELTAAIKQGKQNSKPVDLSKPIGRLTRIDEIAQQNMAKANLFANQKKLKSVEAALGSIKKGDYGECAGCGEQISFGRLLAQPESVLCIECKEEIEN